MLKKQTPLSEVKKLAPACKCNDCNHGCTMGSGFFTNDQLPKVAKYLKITEQEFKEKHLDQVEKFNTRLHKPKLSKYPYGKCTFFDNGCQIHDVKPLECQISMGCKDYGEQLSIWFMLNHFINENDPESIRQFNTYLKTGGKTIHGGQLSDFMDESTLKRILSYEVIK